MSPLVHRLALVGLVVAAYWTAVRPARVLFLEHVAVPLFASGAEVMSGRIRLDADRTVVLASGPGVDERSLADEALYKTPLGDRPMLGVLVLAMLYPRRRWWLALAATALAEGVVTTACFSAGTHGVAYGFVVHRIAQAVLNDTLPLTVPALLFLLDRAGFLRSEVAHQVSGPEEDGPPNTSSRGAGAHP
ncbi:MAG TPA: hypothetical protein VF594_12620 [Rubricoccaceae bacterium]|jgi:hypothetical protein